LLTLASEEWQSAVPHHNGTTEAKRKGSFCLRVSEAESTGDRPLIGLSEVHVTAGVRGGVKHVPRVREVKAREPRSPDE
jgi:hypothetical protein